MPRPFASATMPSPLWIAAGACIVLAGCVREATEARCPGLLYCANNDDGSVGDISYDIESRKCYYCEGDGKGGALRVCLTCDENWRNCKESFGARRSKLSTSPPSLEGAPNTDDSGFGTKLWGGNLGNEFRIDGGTERVRWPAHGRSPPRKEDCALRPSSLGPADCRDADCQRLFGATVHKPRLSN